MAYYSTQCVSCTDGTKRCEGEYCVREKNGRKFRADMYVCSNEICKLNIARQKGQKQLKMLLEGSLHVRSYSSPRTFRR